MTIDFAPKIATEILKHPHVINHLKEEISILIADKDYGTDIAELYIGITCVSPQFAQFFNLGRPKYTKGHRSYTKEDVDYKSYNSFEYDIKIDFEYVRNADESAARKFIIKELLASFNVFKIFKDFNGAQFESVLKHFFNSKGWL